MSTTIIPLTRGYEMVVDEADYPWMCAYRWSAHERRLANGHHKAYALRVQRREGKMWTIYSHREIVARIFSWEFIEHFIVDHRNRNRLNNTRGNLRICTRRENNINVDRDGKPLHFVGVQFREDRIKHPYQAKIQGLDGVRKHIGCFRTAEEAAAAYDTAAIEIYGVGSWTNFGTPIVELLPAAGIECADIPF